MNRISKVIIFNILFSVALFEVVSALFLRDRLQGIHSGYLQGNGQSLGRGYPRYHFQSNVDRGFDISKSSKQVVAYLPKEIEPYPVWGNKIGCFDSDIHEKERYPIYLAGDSYTWGYANYNDKFGTILEDQLNVNVAACGVTHTGQMHQFSKFKEISSSLGYYPKTVIVNVVLNDIENDFLFPKTTVVQGYMADYATFEDKDSQPVRVERDIIDLEQRTIELLNKKLSAKQVLLNLRQYSATAVLAIDLITKIKNTASNQCRLSHCYADNSNKTYPIAHSIASKNRAVIGEWIKDSQRNGYRLIFSDLNTQLLFEKTPDPNLNEIEKRQDFCNFIRSINGECHSLIKYLKTKASHGRAFATSQMDISTL